MPLTRKKSRIPVSVVSKQRIDCKKSRLIYPQCQRICENSPPPPGLQTTIPEHSGEPLNFNASLPSNTLPLINISNHVPPKCLPVDDMHGTDGCYFKQYQGASYSSPPIAKSLGFNGPSYLSVDDVDPFIKIRADELLLKSEELTLRREQLELRKRSLILKSKGNLNTSEFKGNDGAICGDTISNALKSLVLGAGLPKIELEFFDGSPRDYWRFKKDFECNISSKIDDGAQCLSYLMYYCKGRAKEAIEHCVLIGGDLGYQTALSILEAHFGQPHMVAKAVTQTLFEGPKIDQSDVEGLSHLVRQMTGSLLTMTQLNKSGDLDCSSNISRIVRRLPFRMQDSWAEVAEKSFSAGRDPLFSDLLDFVKRRVSIMSNEYGELARSSYNSDSTTKRFPRSNLNAIALSSQTCYYCKSNHQIDNCDKFCVLSWNDKRLFLRRSNRCFNCLGANHAVSSCRSASQCSIPSCGGMHHTSLHLSRERKSDLDQARGECYSSVTNNSVRLGFVPVRIQGHKYSVTTYAFLDNGSDVTLIDEKLAKHLELSIKPCSLLTRTLHGSKVIEGGETEVILRSLENDKIIIIEKAFVVPTLPVQQAQHLNANFDRWPHLDGIKLTKLSCSRVGILIGGDAPEAHWTIEQRIGTRTQPYAVRSTLGWVLRGPSTNESKSVSINSTEVLNLEDRLRSLFEFEFSECGDPNEKVMSLEDKRAEKLVESTIHLVDGHYEVGLPWRQENTVLPCNKGYALCRLSCLNKRLRQDPVLSHRYSEIIRDHLNKGYITRIADDQTSDFSRWYIPHHAVINPFKPDKLRIVFDCAARYRERSLNSSLLQGPDLMNNLTGVLLRFRKFPVAVSADIQEMFHQVRLLDRDKWALNFLWCEGGNFDKPPSTYQFNVHPFGATSSPFCSTFALRRTALDNENLFSSQSTSVVKDNFYVDDCLVSFATVDEAIKVAKELKEMLSRGGFNLTKWMSNKPGVVDELNGAKHECAIPLPDGKECTSQRILGVHWDIINDCFVFRFIPPNNPRTKRGLLSTVASIYDPLGILAPLILPAKCLLQQLCYSNLGWDSPINNEVEQLWTQWQERLSSVVSISVPRCLDIHMQVSRREIHVFADACEYGYGAVAYIRLVTINNVIQCSFLMGKSRVAPKKLTTIPRLELTAAVLAAKLANFVQRELKVSFDRLVMWSDSTIVLHYIRNTTTRFSLFVSNRIRIIHDYTEVDQWRHAPSELNPADVASRGAKRVDSARMNLWLRGPPFIYESDSTWPTMPLFVTPLDAAIELKTTRVAAVIQQKSCWYDEIFVKSSTWIKLLKTFTWLTRFINYLLVMKLGRQGCNIKIGPIQSDELSEATLIIARLVQHSSFTEHVSLAKLKPVTVNGVLRIGGRVTAVRKNVLGPIILPDKHPVSDLLIRHHHRMNGHSGAMHVLSCIRKTFWIIKGMANVRRVIGKCATCRLMFSKPCSQIMAPLPDMRTVGGGYPFEHCGVDYFGPLEVRANRKTHKRYGCLFTCLKTRAIHIEISHSISSDSFIMAFFRFTGRRGTPKSMYSDNGSNFVGANNEIKRSIEQLNHNKISNELLTMGVDWYFNPPGASHRGGVWERMIRSTKKILQVLSKEQTLSEESLLTYIVEVERIINDRPLVPVYDDVDHPYALTPNDLLLLRSNQPLLPDEVTLSERYTRRWRQAQHLANMFWKRWTREYLPMLQSFSKWLRPSRNVQKGDLVLVVDRGTPRGIWRKGVINNVELGDDGHVRTAYVITPQGQIKRDIRSLCLLEGYEERIAQDAVSLARSSRTTQ